MHFQIIELCDAASDEAIREILEHLPEGLHDTYTRVLRRIAKTGSRATVLKIMMWMVCARRSLRVEELQEAVAFDSHDRSWNADKIPDAEKMIKSCLGLVVRDDESGNEKFILPTTQSISILCLLKKPYWPQVPLMWGSPRREYTFGQKCTSSDVTTSVLR